MRIAVLCGDARQAYVASGLYKAGYEINAYNLCEQTDVSDRFNICSSLIEATTDTKIIVLPVPMTKDGSSIFSLTDKTTELSELLNIDLSDKVVFGGIINDMFKITAEQNGAIIYDYFKEEPLIIKNAVITAEGAIALIINNTNSMLCGTSALIIGFGRIGKIISKMLSGMGVRVSVCVRKDTDYAWCQAYGYTPIYLDNLNGNISTYRCIVNTAPHMVLDPLKLDGVHKNCFLLDLASKPGGIDFAYAEKLGLNVLWALSLPGKVSKVSAGEYIKDEVLKIIRKEVL